MNSKDLNENPFVKPFVPVMKPKREAFEKQKAHLARCREKALGNKRARAAQSDTNKRIVNEKNQIGPDRMARVTNRPPPAHGRGRESVLEGVEAWVQGPLNLTRQASKGCRQVEPKR